MTRVLSVPVAVVHEISVVVVANGFVATVSTVSVVFDRVLCLRLVLVIVTVVQGVVVGVVNVVGVVIVLDRLMSAVDTVLMLG
ncbi:hypothetical protein [Cryobacterium sp. Y11]|uniref:hypothetical protein n=1 Tax=Cryobacterium sp. Y11 TaxID=2045016 RepID=UPI001304BEE5|nr:hypothetical protein [Cryobacterium sp. Y11]